MGKVKESFFTDEDDFPDIGQSSCFKNRKEERIRKREKLRRALKSGHRVFIVKPSDYAKQLAKAEEDSEEMSSRRVDKYLLLMKEYECLSFAKKLIRFPLNAIKNIETLKSHFPHAKSILNSIIAQIHLQLHAKIPYAKLPPILLVGTPGTGKSKLASEIAKAIAPTYFYINLATAPEAFILTGLTLGYEGGDAGEIAQILKHHLANSFIIIEEIDKASGLNNQTRTPAVVPLLDLLEMDSAKIFYDDALSMNINTSYLSYIATANDIHSISDALLSRMQVFQINQPSKEQMINNICDSIWQDIIASESWGHAFSCKLSIELKEKLSEFSSRKVKANLKLAASYAAQRNQNKNKKRQIILQLSDLKNTSEKRSPMGFT